MYDIARVQNNYLWRITSKNLLKQIVNITFINKLFSFYPRRFLAQSLRLSLSQFPNIKFNLLTLRSKTWKYFIHSIIIRFLRLWSQKLLSLHSDGLSPFEKLWYEDKTVSSNLTFIKDKFLPHKFSCFMYRNNEYRMYPTKGLVSTLK